MPGPDYPWATYIPGAVWEPRPARHDLRAIVLHARPLDTPAKLQQLRGAKTGSVHYVITESGAVIQLIPHRGWCRHVGRTHDRRLSDQYTIAIALDGDPHRPSWVDHQVLAAARVISVIWSTHGHLPVRDAGNLASPAGRIPRIEAWPWLEMLSRTLRLDTPIDRIYDAMLADPQPESPEDPVCSPVLQRWWEATTGGHLSVCPDAAPHATIRRDRV